MTESYDNDDFEGIYVISVAAHMVGMHPQTLRMYEKAGLLSPKRTQGKSRRYSDEDIRRLREIQELTHTLGVNLAGARLIIEMRERQSHLEELIEEIEAKRDAMEKEMEREIERIRKSYSRDIIPRPPGDISKY